MRPAATRVLVLSAVLLGTAVNGASEVHDAFKGAWIQRQRVAAETPVSFRIALASAKSDQELDSVIQALSDVTSPQYGQYLTPSELRAHWGPEADGTLAMGNLMADLHDAEVSVNDVGDYWNVRMSAATAEHLFSTQLYEYQHHAHEQLRVVRPEGAFTIPTQIASHVTYVDGLEHFPTEKQAQLMARRVSPGRIVDDVLPKSSKSDPYQQHTYHPPLLSDDIAVSESEPDYITTSQIRAQYQIPDDAKNFNGTHVRNKLIVGAFLEEFYKERDLQQFIDQFERKCLPSTFKFPATKGDCLADRPESSAANHRATGEASLDVQAVVALSRSENVVTLCYTGLRDSTRPFADDNQEPFLTFLQDINAMHPAPAVVSISYTDDECAVPESYARAVNREFMKAAMKGITILVAAGDGGVQSSHLVRSFCHLDGCSVFQPMFPSSSPYITSVGATTFKRTNGGHFTEIVTSSNDGALITSGGGFSALFPQPSYQAKAVERYVAAAALAGVPPSMYHHKGRAYPDIAALGHLFPVYVNGRLTPTDGTSVSAPIVASVVSLVNKVLIESGQPVLGFFNPLLYQMLEVCPHVFQDVTSGDTACGGGDLNCCSKGHVATTGWDATSGVGSIKFAPFVRSFQQCVRQIQQSKKLKTQLVLMGEEEADWSEAQALTVQAAVSLAMFLAVVLGSVLLSLRSKLFPSQVNGTHRAVANDSASEYLLADHDATVDA
ncbi:TPA: hypothetical protein N0F65_000759 [Lagenidium giganteum]|uniref:subtilisin n=1 Tax=Lagenidium giganteum TaxID=4803 RepID=A0AAV2ZGE1_9STRA|nr:TPA: hypothetical protein N0F65_000759 [Lagenidium giganteum]